MELKDDDRWRVAAGWSEDRQKLDAWRVWRGCHIVAAFGDRMDALRYGEWRSMQEAFARGLEEIGA